MPPHNAPSWKTLVARLADDVELALPVTQDSLAAAEGSLGLPLPRALREFLLEADGLKGDYSSRVVWSAAEILENNRELRSGAGFRRLYMPFDHLLFFGDDSGGNRFAYAINAAGEIRKSDIYRWDHESDSRSWHSGRLEQYLERRLKSGG